MPFCDLLPHIVSSAHVRVTGTNIADRVLILYISKNNGGIVPAIATRQATPPTFVIGHIRFLSLANYLSKEEREDQVQSAEKREICNLKMIVNAVERRAKITMWRGIVGESFSPEQFDHYVAGLSFGIWRPSFVVLHNTGVPKLRDWHSTQGEQRMRNFEHYYRDEKGWGAGPHLFVANDKIWVFTPLTVKGVHSPSWNPISWGVEMVGDYDEEDLDSNVYNNTISALVTLHAKMGLDSHTIKFHREDPKTTHRHCPGSKVNKATVITDVHNRLIERYQGEHTPDRLK